jgi:hypothetical protein
VVTARQENGENNRRRDNAQDEEAAKNDDEQRGLRHQLLLPASASVPRAAQRGRSETLFDVCPRLNINNTAFEALNHHLGSG